MNFNNLPQKLKRKYYRISYALNIIAIICFFDLLITNYFGDAILLIIVVLLPWICALLNRISKGNIELIDINGLKKPQVGICLSTSIGTTIIYSLIAYQVLTNNLNIFYISCIFGIISLYGFYLLTNYKSDFQKETKKMKSVIRGVFYLVSLVYSTFLLRIINAEFDINPTTDTELIVTELTDVSLNRSKHYYVKFNNDLGEVYKIEIDRDQFGNLKIGQKVEININTGLFHSKWIKNK